MKSSVKRTSRESCAVADRARSSSSHVLITNLPEAAVWLRGYQYIVNRLKVNLLVESFYKPQHAEPAESA